MTPNPETPRRVLVLLSDTGGGHRAAAEAIRAAAEERYAGQLVFDMVDVFRDYTPVPFNHAPEIYPLWVNHAQHLWQLSYTMSDHPVTSRWIVRLLTAYWRPRIQRMLAEHPADVILNVHSVIARPVMNILCQQTPRPPFMTVVTDLVTAHAFWYDPRVERCLVPTPAARQRGLDMGLHAGQIAVTGLPVHPDFVRNLAPQAQARRELGIDPHLPAVLLVAGGEGMGPLLQIAAAVDAQGAPCQLLIVAGRNQTLRAQLEAHAWHNPAHIFGFVDFMPRLMAAADMIVTKAGPATISEACMAGLPIIISGRVPGQEDGNIALLLDEDVGVFAPTPEAVAAAVATWLQASPQEMQRRAERARALSQPDAAWTIAGEVYELARRERWGNAWAARRHPQRYALLTSLLNHFR
ncbi:MAG: MGDG synthase family glycosyltransferase [Anaerolineales bacterium]